MTADQAWPDTRHVAPPADDRWRSVAWLLGRHPHLARLADRIPGLTSVDADGPDLDLNVLADADPLHPGRVVSLVAVQGVLVVARLPRREVRRFARYLVASSEASADHHSSTA